ncbi:MAG: D-sedoheptulose-7-phosphate isomerase [Candidatus Dormibacteria bacterium]
MQHRTVIQAQLDSSVETLRLSAQCCVEAASAVASAVVDCFAGGNKVLLCGNGGSAADCQHVAAEFVGQLSPLLARPGLPAIALTTDTSFLTGFSNDRGYDEVFSRQVAALGQPGDILICISTSGESTNVLEAARTARKIGMVTVGLTGSHGALAHCVDHCIAVPHQSTQRIQEALLPIEHAICWAVEQQMFGSTPAEG